MPLLRSTVNLIASFAVLCVPLIAGAISGDRDGSNNDVLGRTFATSIKPFVDAYCVDCHSGPRPKSKFDISPYTSVKKVIDDFGHWGEVLDKLTAGEMPPDDEEKQPTAEQRTNVVQWIRAVMRREAERHAGDPGIVLARRLSNAEYDYTIRDLTGVDIRPTREFPIDPANEAGFDNTGESLSLSPALLKKYLEAARNVTEHLVLLPDGFTFAPFTVMTDTDRDKYCVQRIIDFYKRQPTDLADYFFAAWKLKSTGSTNVTDQEIETTAVNAGISTKYLHAVWRILTGDEFNAGPIAALRIHWRALPMLGSATDAEVRAQCRNLGDEVQNLRAKLAIHIPFLISKGIHNGCQAFVLWHNRHQAAVRRALNTDVLHIDNSDVDQASQHDPELTLASAKSERAEQMAAFQKFCSVFPDAFYISERGREFLNDPKELANEKGRFLSAGFHSMMGYFRDDQPLCELVLSESELSELNELWTELDFVTSAPMRQHTGLVWFERTDSGFMRGAEFDFARAEDKDVTSEAKIQQLAEVYLAKAIRLGAGEQAQEAIKEHFTNINASIRKVEKERIDAEPSHLRALEQFAERAYRRPLSEAEKKDLMDFYRAQKAAEDGSHDEAVRDTLMSILVSPYFWYRVDQPSDQPGIHPLTDLALASRLSYFLWSSMPDDELRAVAAAGKLHNPDVLLAQTRRMLNDQKARALAVEFGGNWLGFRQFENHNSVDRQRFPMFNNELRESMFQEPIHFLTYVVQKDRPILDLLFADYTFVDSVLAAHYGVDKPDLKTGQWAMLQPANQYGRGGLLPMAVFQTANSPGLRTSPVKRGNWVVKQLLGEHIPAPPPNVPKLPDNEGIGKLTLRQQLERHRQDKNCAACHKHFDSIGLAFEGYGPVGERRTLDLGGRPVDVHAEFPGGGEGSGLEGLKDYLRDRRQGEFVDNFCRKLFSYALGRTLILSDDPTIETMEQKLKADGYRIQSLIESIVTSPQFLTRRGRLDLANN